MNVGMVFVLSFKFHYYLRTAGFINVSSALVVYLFVMLNTIAFVIKDA